jgi:DNA-binding response OmpR family regulator
MNPSATPPKKILVVEDEESIAIGVRDALEHYGHTVDVAVDGASGLERAREGEYHLLILDLMLPGISGFELLKTLRSE